MLTVGKLISVLETMPVARSRQAKETPNRWKTGSAIGAVVGELKKVDDLESGHEFVIVPPVGASQVTCIFPENLRDRMGDFLFKTVRVEGVLHYAESSPFPQLVDANNIIEMPKRRKTFAQMRLGA